MARDHQLQMTPPVILGFWVILLSFPWSELLIHQWVLSSERSREFVHLGHRTIPASVIQSETPGWEVVDGYLPIQPSETGCIVSFGDPADIVRQSDQPTEGYTNILQYADGVPNRVKLDATILNRAKNEGYIVLEYLFYEVENGKQRGVLWPHYTNTCPKASEKGTGKRFTFQETRWVGDRHLSTSSAYLVLKHRT